MLVECYQFNGNVISVCVLDKNLDGETVKSLLEVSVNVLNITSMSVLALVPKLVPVMVILIEFRLESTADVGPDVGEKEDTVGIL